MLTFCYFVNGGFMRRDVSYLGKFSRWMAVLVCWGATALFASAQAQTYTESGDAGQTLATAQTVPGGVTTINGTLNVSGDVDLYKLTFSTAASVTFHATSAGDPNLILFDSAGHGLWGDDDAGGGPSGLDSQITWTVAPGTYYLAYGNNNIYGYDSANNMFCGDDSGNCSGNTTSVLDHFSSQAGPTQPYTITLSAATAGPAAVADVQAVPTVGEWAMLGLMALLAASALGRIPRRQR